MLKISKGAIVLLSALEGTIVLCVTQVSLRTLDFSFLQIMRSIYILHKEVEEYIEFIGVNTVSCVERRSKCYNVLYVISIINNFNGQFTLAIEEFI